VTYYDWICHECEAIWEVDYPLGTAPKQTPCPDCGELRNRNWGSVTTFKMKGDCHTNRVRARKYYEDGLTKDEAHEYYDESIAASKRAIATGWRHYSKMTPNFEQGVKDGVVRRRSESEARNAKETARKLTEKVYNDVGHKISSSLHKPQ